MLDPVGLSSLTVESYYVDLHENENRNKWKELPLATLRKQFTSPAEKAFLQNHVIDAQKGEPIPKPLMMMK